MYSGFQYSWLHIIFHSLILFYIIALAGKASFNLYVGGDLWKPYIGNLEIGLWMFSFTNNAEPELVGQKERRHPFAYPTLSVTYKINCLDFQSKTILQSLNHLKKASTRKLENFLQNLMAKSF